MDSAVIAAIIVALGAVVAAVIAALLKRRRGEQPTQVAQAGGHAIVAGGQAVQTIHLGRQAPPRPHKLLSLAEEILRRTSESLLENERLLHPVIRNPGITRYSVGEKLATLFEQQRDRGAFGEWQGVLENALEKETNPRLQAAIAELLEAVRRLHRSFYSYHESVEDKGERETKKHFVELVLGNRRSDPLWYQVPDDEVARIVRSYLDFLRESVEKVGRATGELRLLVE